jgi:peptide chain release factor subunit 1
MKNVISAIESIMSRLKQFKQPPENGVIFFVGHKSVGSDKTEMVAFVIEPPIPIATFLYRCDSTFYLDPLEEMLVEKEIYGLLLIDRRECTVGLLKGNRVELLKYMTSQVPGKHGRGGQSQRRFERLTEVAAHEWFVRCGEQASDIFKTIFLLVGQVLLSNTLLKRVTYIMKFRIKLLILLTQGILMNLDFVNLFQLHLKLCQI